VSSHVECQGQERANLLWQAVKGPTKRGSAAIASVSTLQGSRIWTLTPLPRRRMKSPLASVIRCLAVWPGCGILPQLLFPHV
jgi:hypothetical protein